MNLPTDRIRKETLSFLMDSLAEELRINLAMEGDELVKQTERIPALTEALKNQQMKTALYQKKLDSLG